MIVIFVEIPRLSRRKGRIEDCSYKLFHLVRTVDKILYIKLMRMKYRSS